jgi:UDP-N-acetylmuramoyl-tripeptide--D-alanyl-D-alanine ligase
MWTATEIIQATQGSGGAGVDEIASVSIDSRTLTGGALFVALQGDRFDGHDYVRSALARGAKAALVSSVPEGLQGDARLIRVEDTQQALVALARAARTRMQGKIIAVTGSVGKTGTKEAIRTALSAGGSVYATQGNLNNHIGLPLSLANLPAKTDFGVFELGMNHAGEISALTRILQPDIAIITNVEAVHLEFFDSVAAIANAKAEILEGLPPDGTVILNRDNIFYERLLAEAKGHGSKNIITFGEHWEADCRLANYQFKDFGSQVDALIYKTPITYHLGTVGHHWALTSLAALATVTALGVYLADAAAALANFHEPEGRGRMQMLTLAEKTIYLVDDCYNASPVSMNAGFARLAELHKNLSESAAAKGRKIAALGDMLELGTASEELHKSLLAGLEQHGIDKLYATGKYMKHLYDFAPAGMHGGYAAEVANLAKILAKDLQHNDIVLLKGSHGSRMDIVRDAINRKIREEAHAV